MRPAGRLAVRPRWLEQGNCGNREWSCVSAAEEWATGFDGGPSGGGGSGGIATGTDASSDGAAAGERDSASPAIDAGIAGDATRGDATARSGRNPKIGGDFSQVHLFNNYWLNVTYFCITAKLDPQARVESNYFENSSRPHWLQLDGNGTAGIAIDTGNVYTGVSTGNTNRDVGGTVFTVPYAFIKETATAARQRAIDCPGPQPIR